MFRALPLTMIAVLSLGTAATRAQTPQPTAPVPFARPGHEPGVGQSLPLSDKASNITASDAKTPIAPTLPDAGLGENASPEDYLRTAREALQAGHTGQAQQALEMAETRMLDRGVVATKAGDPIQSHRISQITSAREALGRGDTSGAILLIGLAMQR